jgi:3-isopropylmalate/(R)-2-methylmalate dehydratase large subunit
LGVQIEGELHPGVGPKDVILALIRKLGAGGGTGYVAEYFGSTIRRTGMSGRMTICNMSIEMGARAGLIAPDDTTFEYISAEDRPFVPKGQALDRLIDHSRTLFTESTEGYDRFESLDVSELKPQITWGTTPAMTVDIDQAIPEPRDAGEQRALSYMGITPGSAMQDLKVNTVFIGSCTNARIEDIRAAASVVRGRHVATGVRAMVVPGSVQVRQLAEKEGLKELFVDAGFEWHQSGCSMCLGMNGDILRPMERSASTSNRPYEGRQGPGSRTHLVSPLTAAATAIAGHFADPREYLS